jgi:hypothetical protein
VRTGIERSHLSLADSCWPHVASAVGDRFGGAERPTLDASLVTGRNPGSVAHGFGD